jgi:hypothetical protein
VINVDHSGRSLSPLPIRAVSNFLTTPTRCRISGTDHESIRKLSKSMSKDVADMIKGDDGTKCLTSNFNTDDTDRPIGPQQSPPTRASWSPDDLIPIVVAKYTESFRAAAAPVSVRSSPTTTNISLSLPALPITTAPPSSLESADTTGKLATPVETGKVSPANVPLDAFVMTPPSTITKPKIESASSSGTPGKKCAAAPVSVRSTNKPPPIVVEIDQFDSENSSPRSDTLSPRAMAAVPRYSNGAMPGFSSISKQKSGHSSFDSWNSNSVSPVNRSESRGILQSLTKRKNAFFASRGGSKVDRSGRSSDISLSSPSLASDDGESFKSGLSPSGNSSPSPSWNPVKLSTHFDDSVRNVTDSVSKKEPYLGLKTLQLLRSLKNSEESSGIARTGSGNIGVMSPKSVSKQSPSLKTGTSVSSLWAFATEYPSVDKDGDFEVERRKPNRMSPDAIAGAIARQAGKVITPSHSSFLHSMVSPTSENKNGIAASEKKYNRTSAEDVRRSLPITATRRRSSAPAIPVEECCSEIKPDELLTTATASSKGSRQKLTERAVSLPTISREARSQYHTTSISSLWDLSADYSDHEKEGSSRTHSQIVATLEMK